MKIRLLIATEDSDYAEHMSNVLVKKHSDTFEVNVCSTANHLKSLIVSKKFDVLLIEPSIISSQTLNLPSLPLLLWDNMGEVSGNFENYTKIRKYQRISSIVGDILENCSDVNSGANYFNSDKAYIAVFWSPAGGAGKTTTALAYAARKVADGKQATYLNLEYFSSVPAYFAEDGKSISTVFGKLGNNAHLLLRGIRRQDSNSGIVYFGQPENYDDINILNVDDISALLTACTQNTDILVIDLSSVCDDRTQQIFEMSDIVFLVSDASKTSQVKLNQFIKQHNVFERIQSKSVLINNKGARITEQSISRTVSLPYIQSDDAVVVYKSLSANNFGGYS